VKSILAAALVLGCSAGISSGVATTAGPTITMEAFAADSIANALVARAFAADAALQEPDTLYIDDAEILANGEPRADAPRLAGVGLDGRVQLGSSRFTISGSFVYGTIEYRWVPRTVGELASEGRATFVLGRDRAGGWRILHVHSSTPPVEVETPRPERADSTERSGR